MPLFGPPNIKKMETRRDIQGLIKALSYPKDVEICRRAAQALGSLKDARAVEPLIAELRGTNKNIRQSAAKALGKIGDTAAVIPLVDMLDDDITTRQDAARALVALYQGSKLDRQSKEKILQLRAWIKTKHYDEHTDDNGECARRDYHTDSGGIGVDFPL